MALTAELEGQFSSEAAHEMRKRLRDEEGEWYATAAAEDAEEEEDEDTEASETEKVKEEVEEEVKEEETEASATGTLQAEEGVEEVVKDEVASGEDEHEVASGEDEQEVANGEDVATTDAAATYNPYVENYGDRWGNKSLPELSSDLAEQYKKLQRHPWAGGTQSTSKRQNLSEEELEILRTEQGISAHCQVPWKNRGLPAQDDPDPTWRGQALRSGKQGGQIRYANSGGKRRDYYAMLGRTGRLETTPTGAVVKEHVKGWKKGDPDPPRFGKGAKPSTAPSSSKGEPGSGSSEAPWRARRKRAALWNEL